MKKASQTSPKEIQSVARAIHIMDCFDSRRILLTLAEISEIVELNKSTVHGILHTLCKYGYMDQDSKTGKYMLGKELANKGLLVTGSQPGKLESVSVKYLKQLTSRFQVTSYLFSYHNDRLTCLEMLIPTNSSYGAVVSVLGRKMAFHAAASGKLVLAHYTRQELDNYLQKTPLYAFTQATHTTSEAIHQDVQRTVQKGYAHEYNEVEDDLSALAMPIYDGNGSLVGTLSISEQTSRVAENFSELVETMLEFSKAISEKIV